MSTNTINVPVLKPRKPFKTPPGKRITPETAKPHRKRKHKGRDAD